jgi:3-phenylpropionate/trans-cinnamate dioxygenase ferredoxin subunit
MSSLVEIGKANELAAGSMKQVTVQGRAILLAKVGDRFFAADSICPHMSGNLSRGKLEGTIVTCPRHASQFDLTDGHNVRWLRGTGLVATVAKFIKPPRGIATYPVKVENGNILIEI